MDNEQTIDSFVDELSAMVDAEAGSSPEPETVNEVVPDAPEAVAPVQVESPEVSSADVVPEVAAVETPVPAAPATDPDLIARLEAAEQRAARSEQLIEQAAQEAQRRAYMQAQEQQNAEFQRRAIAIENLTDPELQKAEAARLVREVQQAREAEARVVLQQREQQIAAVEQAGEKSAAIAAGFYQTIQARTDLTEAQKQEILQDTKFYAQYPSPQAQQAAIERDRSLVSTAVARAKAEWEKANGQAIEQRTKQRTASDTDLVGTSAGSAGGKIQTNDDFVDSLFK
jgi:hypothetical protein